MAIPLRLYIVVLLCLCVNSLYAEDLYISTVLFCRSQKIVVDRALILVPNCCFGIVAFLVRRCHILLPGLHATLPLCESHHFGTSWDLFIKMWKWHQDKALTYCALTLIHWERQVLMPLWLGHLINQDVSWALVSRSTMASLQLRTLQCDQKNASRALYDTWTLWRTLWELVT